MGGGRDGRKEERKGRKKEREGDLLKGLRGIDAPGERVGEGEGRLDFQGPQSS